jgi:hypothetical protein
MQEKLKVSHPNLNIVNRTRGGPFPPGRGASKVSIARRSIQPYSIYDSSLCHNTVSSRIVPHCSHFPG